MGVFVVIAGGIRTWIDGGVYGVVCLRFVEGKLLAVRGERSPHLIEVGRISSVVYGPIQWCPVNQIAQWSRPIWSGRGGGERNLVSAFGWRGVPDRGKVSVQADVLQHGPYVIGRGVPRVLV